MAMAVVVLAVVAFFMAWSFQKPQEEEPEPSVAYTVVLASGFRGDSLCVYMDDALVFGDVVERDSLSVNVRSESDGEHFLMVEMPQTGMAYAFNIPAGERRATLHFDGAEVTMEEEK